MSLNKKPFNYLPVVVLVSVGINVGSVALQLFNTLAISGLTKSTASVYTTLPSGQPLVSVALPTGERTSEGIKYFATTTLYQLFNWDNRKDFESVLDIHKGEIDKGVTVSTRLGQPKVPTNTWQASYALSNSFRQEFLEKIAELIPSEVFSGQVRVLLIFTDVSEPESLGDGKWKLTVNGDLNFFRGNTPVKSVPFARQVYVETIAVPAIPKAEDETASALYAARLSGLQIYHLEEIDHQIR